METDTRIDLTPGSRNHLTAVAKWARFIAIAGFIMIGLLMVFGIIMSVMMSKIPNAGTFGTAMGLMMFVMYAIAGGIYYFPLRFLLKFSGHSLAALSGNDPAELEKALLQLKHHYLFIGILVIIGLAVYLLMFLGGLAAYFIMGSFLPVIQ